MEQRLDATYLRPGLVERTIAIGIGAVCVGTGILLAAWGISFLWRYTPPEIAVRIANPEVHVAQDAPLKVIPGQAICGRDSQNRSRSTPQRSLVKVDEPSRSIDEGVSTDLKTAAGDVIRREVTVFSNVEHRTGAGRHWLEL